MVVLQTVEAFGVLINDKSFVIYEDIFERRMQEDEMSQRKLVEEELLVLNQELELRVEARTAVLKEAYREQEAFSYSVSHDLRAPLRHIKGYCALLQASAADSLSEDVLGYIDRICAARDRMETLINDLLQLSQIGRAEINRHPVNLSQLAQETADMLRNTDISRTAVFTIAADAIASADQSLVRQILENLLGNAWKYTQRQQETRIEFGVTTTSGTTTYFVKDNGVGFDTSYKEKIFLPFQRLHGHEFEGSGIGLATVKRIVKRHDGRIWGESTAEGGATFYFTLGV